MPFIAPCSREIATFLTQLLEEICCDLHCRLLSRPFARAALHVYLQRPSTIERDQRRLGAPRGFGMPQLVWAYEGHTDLIARGLGLDPVEFRRKNMLRDGRPHATGTIMRDAATAAVLDRLARRIGWGQPFERANGTRRRGRGIAFGLKAAITPMTSVGTIAVAADGSCTVYCGTVDMGQGSTTAMAQIAAETLGLDAEAVRVIAPDTDVTPYDMGALGSRSTFHMGRAVQLAAAEAKTKLAAVAACAPCRSTGGADRRGRHETREARNEMTAFHPAATAATGSRNDRCGA
jgi:CO/xanthine dehydrogenase Mo-binding subunit